MQGVVVQALASPVTPKAVINYIHEGPIDDKQATKTKVVPQGFYKRTD